MTIIKLDSFEDNRGLLTVCEKTLPFEIKRVYWISNSTALRGGHRHVKTCQAFCCLNGATTIELNNGKRKVHYELNDPRKVLIVQPEDWHTMLNHTKHTVLLVLASHFYDKKDYVYEQYD